NLCLFNDTATTEIYTLSLHDALPINDTATTEIYTLSLHDALPISVVAVSFHRRSLGRRSWGSSDVHRREKAPSSAQTPRALHPANSRDEHGHLRGLVASSASPSNTTVSQNNILM